MVSGDSPEGDAGPVGDDGGLAVELSPLVEAEADVFDVGGLATDVGPEDGETALAGVTVILEFFFTPF